MAIAKTVLLAGASGALGHKTGQALRAAGHVVRALVRTVPAGEPPVGLTWVRGDGFDLDSLHAACRGVDCVVSCMGAKVAMRLQGRAGYRDVDVPIHRNLLAAMRQAAVPALVYVSAHHDAELAPLPYFAAHRLVEELALATPGLQVTVLRPTGLFSAFAGLLPVARLGALPLFGDGTAKSNPIADADVAALLVRAVAGELSGIVPAGGPEILSRAELLSCVLAAAGRRPRLLRVPASWIRLALRLGHPLHPRLCELVEFALAVSLHDCVAPMHGSQTLSGYLGSTQRPTAPGVRQRA